MKPKIKIIAISNVYCRMMKFENIGDVEEGHYHTYDHGTLVARGSLNVEMLDENDQVTSSKVFVAPSFVFVQKDKKHRLTSLEEETLACCIHAIRDVDENIISPDTIIDEKQFVDFDRNFITNIPEFFKKEKNIEIKLFTK